MYTYKKTTINIEHDNISSWQCSIYLTVIWKFEWATILSYNPSLKCDKLYKEQNPPAESFNKEQGDHHQLLGWFYFFFIFNTLSNRSPNFSY